MKYIFGNIRTQLRHHSLKIGQHLGVTQESGIADIMQRVLSVASQLVTVGVKRLELIVVDDGSRDRTAEIVRTTPGATLV